MEMRRDKARKHTPDFDTLKQKIQTIADRSLKKVAPMPARSHWNHS